MISQHKLCILYIVVCQYGSSGYPPHETEVVSEAEDKGDQKLEKLQGVVERVRQPATFQWQKGVVWYYIDPDSYDEMIGNRIRAAMNMIQTVSCVVFKPFPEKPSSTYTGHTWLYLTNPDNTRECVHETLIGKGNKAIMTLGYDCMQKRDIIHALLHVLGFRDEVTHPQRDLYVRILWQNIQPKYRPLFRIRTEEMPHKILVEYDTMSVMHFHDRAYTANGGATISPLIPGLRISPSLKLSQLDIMKLRLAFGHECNKRKIGNLYETCQNAMQVNDTEKLSSEEVVPIGDMDGRRYNSSTDEIKITVVTGKENEN